MEEKWYHLTVEQVSAKLKTDINTGLNDKNAQDRLNREGPNTVYDIPRAFAFQACKDVLKDPTVFMLICTVLLGIVFKQPVYAGIILGLIAFNYAVVLGAYIKAKQIICKNGDYSLPTVTVLRNGKKYIVKQDKVCRGDILILNKGDIIPADARVIESNGLFVNEGALFGDYKPKRKSVAPVYGNNLSYEMQNDMVFATSVVVEGRGKAIVCKKGRGNAVYELNKIPTITEIHKIPVLKDLKKFSSVWSMISLSVIFVLTAFEAVFGFGAGELYSIFCMSLALCASGMCELYTVFGYIIIGKGLYSEKKEENSVNIKCSKTIDTASRITTVVIPKDGALISGVTRIEKLYFDNTFMSVTEKRLEKTCASLISCALDSTSYGQNDYEKAFNRFKAKGCSALERTILSFSTHLGLFGFGYTANHIMLEHKEELHHGNVSKSLISDGKRNTLVLRGGIEDVLSLCDDYRSHERVRNIKNEKQAIKDAANRVIKEGYNVVCIASKRTEATTIGQTKKDRDFVFEGFLVVSEPRLYGAKENVAMLKDLGINVIMLCDEAHASNRLYAKEIGIIENDEEIMVGADFKRISELKFEINASRFKYYEGLDSVQKRRLITLLRKNGEVVGCFGNDFEDISMVEEADVGYSAALTVSKGNSKIDIGSVSDAIPLNSEAEKGRGCEALKMASDIIVSCADNKKGGFNAVARSIVKAKTVLLNLENAVKYLICTQSARVCAVIGALMLAKASIPGFGILPMSSLQLLFSGFVIDLCSVMFFAFTEKAAIEGTRSRDKIKPFVYGIWWAVISLTLPLAAFVLEASPAAAQSSTMMFYGFLLTYPVAAMEMSCKNSLIKEITKINKLIIVEAAISILLIVLTASVKKIGLYFSVVSLNPMQWALSLMLPLLMFAVFEATKAAFTGELKIKESDEEDADA